VLLAIEAVSPLERSSQLACPWRLAVIDAISEATGYVFVMSQSHHDPVVFQHGCSHVWGRSLRIVTAKASVGAVLLAIAIEVMADGMGKRKVEGQRRS